jgi:hypothetical protein
MAGRSYWNQQYQKSPKTEHHCMLKEVSEGSGGQPRLSVEASEGAEANRLLEFGHVLTGPVQDCRRFVIRGYREHRAVMLSSLLRSQLVQLW